MTSGQDDIDFGHAVESTGHHPTEAERNAMALQACRKELLAIADKLDTLSRPFAADYTRYAAAKCR